MMFEEYIINGTAEQKEIARNWQIAIGLQDVDGLKVSPYLIEMARKHIEGIISIDEVLRKVEEYHAVKRGIKQESINNVEML